MIVENNKNITGREIYSVGLVFEPRHIMLTDVEFSCPAVVYRALIQVNGEPFCVPISSGREPLFQIAQEYW